DIYTLSLHDALPIFEPLKNMAVALLEATSESPGEEELAAFVGAMRVSGAEAVVERLAERLERDDTNLLLLVDQFEELFRYGGQVSGVERQTIAEIMAGQ